MKVEGGDKLAAVLQRMAKNLQTAKGVRIGFLEDATYPLTDGARLWGAVDRLTESQKADHPDWEPRLSAWAAWANNNHPTLHVAQVAFWNEFGTVTSPPRPFFRQTIDRHASEWGDELKTFLKETNYSAFRSLRLLGLLVKEQIVVSIEKWPADNAPLTVHIKQFNHGLLDSGVMARSVDYEMVR